jgi:hypothetical protein
MLTEAVVMIDRERADEIERPHHTRKLRAAAHRAIAAAFEPQDVRRDRGVRGRRQKIDRAAKGRRSVGEPVAAFVDLGRLQREWIDLVIVAATVGLIGRNAILKNFQAARMV